MKYNDSFFDYDKTSYQLNSNRSPTKFNTYQSYQEPTDIYHNISQPNHPKFTKPTNPDYLHLRQTYNASSKQFLKNTIDSNKHTNQDKFLRNTLDGSYAAASKNRQQLTGSYVGEWYNNHTDRTSFKTNYNEQINHPNKDNTKQSNYQKAIQKINKYQQIDQKLQKSAKIIDQIKKLKDQRKLRMESKKLEELKIEFKKNQESIDTGKNNFSKKNYVEYYTPKFDKAAYEDRFKQKQNLTKALQKNLTPSKQPNYKSPIRQEKSIQLKSPEKRKGTLNILQKQKSLINEFVIGKTLGQGKFGNVYIATHISTNSIYALKKIPKEMIKSHMMIDQFLLQIKLQSFMKHQNILTINGFCDDKEHIYLILEYMEHGTLFKLLKAKKVLNESEAAIYLKQIAQAVKYIHENGIAHRDIKPQNIVMSNGVCKLCDFGWATVCNQRRKTYCGTFDYAAPQILQGIQYDMSVDLWCLGVLAYELMVGKAPFYHISRKQTMKKIINVDSTAIKYPDTLSKNAISFIENLIRKNPDERMRSDSLLNHPFLAQVGNQFY